MNSFETDQQTLNDLQIYPGENIDGSIYSYFNYSKTVGGRKRLKEMLLSPSNDNVFLEDRQKALKFFLEKNISIGLVNFELEFIEDYLDLGVNYLNENYVSVVKLEIQRISGINNSYHKIQSGLRHLCIYLKKLSDISERSYKDDPPGGLLKKFIQINTILSKPVFEKLLMLKTDEEFRYIDSVRFDKIIRKDEKENIKLLLNIIYEFDAFQSIVQTIKDQNLCFPNYCNDPNELLKIEGLFHPSIKAPVRNDILIDRSKNLLFLTGVNMSGKSSFLKALGLSVYLAHVGFPVPAKSMSTPMYNGLLTTLNLSDNINSGYSHYYSEVVRVKKAADLILEKKKMFIIFDELFRGTNVKDAFDASLLIMNALAPIKNSVFFISSHILELASELESLENIRFKCFESKMIDGKPVFDHLLKDGISTNRIGMYIVLNEGIIDVLKKASLN